MRLLTNKRGSAIIMALVTITILLVLGMAVITLSMGTLTTNVADATTNDTYYAAEAGINSAIEQVKTEVVKYYAEMSKLDGNYTSLYDNFFSGIASNSSDHFHKPDIQNMSTIHTTFSAGNINADENTGDILISCEATATDGTKYAVNGSVNVLRIDLRSGGSLSLPELAVYSGGTLNLDTKSRMTVNGHDVVVSSFIDDSNKKDHLTLNNGAALKYLNETTIGTLEDTLSYPGYTNPIINDIDLFINTSNYTIDWSNVPQEPVGIKSTTGANLIISNCTVPDGIIHSGGDIKASNVGGIYADLYCDGKLEASNGSFFGDIYCLGNVSIHNGQFYGNIICGGTLSLSNATCHGFILSDDAVNINNATVNGSVFATGAMDITQTSSNGGLFYSSQELRLGHFNSKGIFYSAGDIVITGNSSMSGMLLAINDIYYTKGNNMTVNYSQEIVNESINDPNNAFFFGGGSGGSGGAAPTFDVIQGQTMTAVGRIN